MKTIIRKIFSITLVLFFLSELAGATDTGSAFLKIIPGAKPAGMGTACTAMAGEIQAIICNPAALIAKEAREGTEGTEARGAKKGTEGMEGTEGRGAKEATEGTEGTEAKEDKLDSRLPSKQTAGKQISGMTKEREQPEGSLELKNIDEPRTTSNESRFLVYAGHVELFQNMKLENVVFAHRAGSGMMSYSFTYMNEGTLEGRDINRMPTGNFKANEFAGQLTYSFPMAGMQCGLGAKGIRSAIDNVWGTGYGLDAGLLIPLGRLNLGISALNVGNSPRLGDETAKLPFTAGAGLALSLPFGSLVTADVRRNVYEKKNIFGGGVEVPLFNTLFLRGGYTRTTGANTDFTDKSNKGLNAGFGLKFLSSRIDYAYSYNGELGNIQRFSLCAGF